MSTQHPDQPLDLTHSVQRHITARQAWWQTIDDAVAAAHAELQTDRNTANQTNPGILDESATPSEQPGTHSG